MTLRNFDRVFHKLKFGWRLMIALSKDSIDEVIEAPWVWFGGGGRKCWTASMRDATSARVRISEETLLGESERLRTSGMLTARADCARPRSVTRQGLASLGSSLLGVP